MLTKFTVEHTLNAELDFHLETEEAHNTRNGYSRKTIHTEDGSIDLTTPQDRNSTFEPALVKKGQRRFTSMDDKILALYARGMTTRDIVDAFKEMYNFPLWLTQHFYLRCSLYCISRHYQNCHV